MRYRPQGMLRVHAAAEGRRVRRPPLAFEFASRLRAVETSPTAVVSDIPSVRIVDLPWNYRN